MIISWFHVLFQFMYSSWQLRHLKPPVVTIFGGARIPQESPYGKMAHELSYALVKNNISVITGGGPGIMAAANCGAKDAVDKKGPIKSIGINVKDLDPEPIIFAQEQIIVDYFFIRKWLMINYSIAFVIFPGGFGTLDELSEIITLMQTKHLSPAPIVLMGKEFWQPLLDWLKNYGLKQQLFLEKDLKLITITDDIKEAIFILTEHCKICKISNHSKK